ncbi:hypothetical protein GGR57DRAFT_518849, partial [Xylariaceae sp. FL1272]
CHLRQSYIAFAGAAAYAEDACRSALSSSGILANVTSRAKDADRLRVKLFKMNDEKAFTSIDDIKDRIMDVIGIRVTLYFPNQVDEVVAKFQSLFFGATRLDVKTIANASENKPWTAKELLGKLGYDKTMSALDPAPTAPENQVGEYKPQYGSYRAVHVRFTLKGYDLGTEIMQQLGGQPLKTEIQIQSLLSEFASRHFFLCKSFDGSIKLVGRRMSKTKINS